MKCGDKSSENVMEDRRNPPTIGERTGAWTQQTNELHSTTLNYYAITFKNIPVLLHHWYQWRGTCQSCSIEGRTHRGSLDGAHKDC